MADLEGHSYVVGILSKILGFMGQVIWTNKLTNRRDRVKNPTQTWNENEMWRWTKYSLRLSSTL